MAEEELIYGHAKQALQSLTDRKKRGKERIGDFFWEVFIIIVAVNITLWFHDWSEKRHDRELEKNFLIGTRNDLDIVKNSLERAFPDIQTILNYYDSVWIQINEHRIDAEFIDTNSDHLIYASYFLADNSRFESFKSSGYLRLIENSGLLNEITRLYNLYFPFQEYEDRTIYEARLQGFNTYIGSKVPIDSSGKMYVSKLLNNSEVKYQIYYQKQALQEMKGQKQKLQQGVDSVMNLIDEELKNRFNYKGKEKES
ncbi:MAG: hypothetical protein FWF53_06205 [Candidatus Azobacteroides sp.]|nr:hypothetical protein [Candidatus Azobacteroides sp.]